MSVENDSTRDWRRRPEPVDRERAFGIEELFFSTTDLKGIIRSGNDVFVRVSAYPREHLEGRPHNLIRHPEMPRAVFQLLWDELEAGRAVAAYVKNLAADGCFYWVLAVAAPAGDDGYVSVRMKPTTPLLDAARAVYADLAAFEAEFEGGDVSRRKPAIAASVARLSELLAGAGFASYAAFESAVLAAEVAAREDALAAAGKARRPPLAVRPPKGVAHVVGACQGVDRVATRLLARLDDYAALNATLQETSHRVRALASDVRDFSMNAMLAANRLVENRLALGSVADQLRAGSDAVAPVIDALTAEVGAAIACVDATRFPIAAGKLEAEMAVRFVRELVEGGNGTAHAVPDLIALADALDLNVEALESGLRDLAGHVRAIAGHVDALRYELEAMRALKTNGRIEAARVAGAEEVVALFDEIGKRILDAHATLATAAAVARIDILRDARAAASIRLDAGDLRTRLRHLAA